VENSSLHKFALPQGVIRRFGAILMPCNFRVYWELVVLSRVQM
jgi:hypothetical protein